MKKEKRYSNEKLTHNDDPLLSPGDRGVDVLPGLVPAVGHAVHDRVRLGALELVDRQGPRVTGFAVVLLT